MKTEKLVTLKHSKNHLTIAFGKTMQCLYKQQNKGSWMSITRAEFGGDRVLVWELVEGCRAATPWYVLHPLSLVKSCFFSLRHRREQEKKEKKEIWLWLYYLCFQGSYKYKNKHEGSHFGHCLKDCKNSHCESELYSKEEKKKEYSISLLFVNANWVTPEKNWKALNLPFQHTWRHMSHGTSYLFIYLYFGFLNYILASLLVGAISSPTVVPLLFNTKRGIFSLWCMSHFRMLPHALHLTFVFPLFYA